MAPRGDPDRFIEMYREHSIGVLQPAEARLRAWLERWRTPHYWRKYIEGEDPASIPAPSPIHRIQLRIKDPESVVAKILRKPQEYPKGFGRSSLDAMPDLIGARVIVYFLTNLPLVDHEIRNSSDIELSKERPPVAYLPPDLVQRFGLSHLECRSKESGYTSVHYVLRLRGGGRARRPGPWVELQVRTMAQDLWGEIEHILGYKPHKQTHLSVTKSFQLLSREILLMDERVSFLFEELIRHQYAGEYSDDDPLNPESLAHVLARAHLGCAQKEVDGLLRLLWSRGIKTARDFLRVATPTRIETINRTYLAEVGCYPSDFEVIANVAILGATKAGADEVNRIRAHIAYLRAWGKLTAEAPEGEA
ncbi:MAG: hypothetical protein KC466_10925 [Myxococcales bacterium]|nr:hypothetical protein [Myxococcales bacterium]